MFKDWFKGKKQQELKKLMISDKDYKELKEMYDCKEKLNLIRNY